MTLCAECKPLSYMTAEFNFLERSLYTEILPFSCITPFCMLKKWMCLVSCWRHKGCDNFVCMPFAKEFKCVGIHSHWSKIFPCTRAFFNSSCKKHNDRNSQGTLSADSRSLSLCFLICPFLCHAGVCGF